MTSDGYIMSDPSEPERIRAKTNGILLDHHLTWTGVAEGDSFVDFGCASGEVVRAVSSKVRGARVLGLDGDERTLQFAAEESRALGLENIDYKRVYITGPPTSGLPDDTFDHAWTRFFLEYQKDPVDVVREMTRVVKPGGKVTLVDIDGNCLWHHPITVKLSADLAEVMSELSTTGFDPHAGARLNEYATAAGLRDIREQVEPYHWIVGAPDEATMTAWTAKITIIQKNYFSIVANTRVEENFFSDFLDMIASPETMTWSLVHLVQGVKPFT